MENPRSPHLFENLCLALVGSVVLLASYIRPQVAPPTSATVHSQKRSKDQGSPGKSKTTKMEMVHAVTIQDPLWDVSAELTGDPVFTLGRPLGATVPCSPTTSQGTDFETDFQGLESYFAGCDKEPKPAAFETLETIGSPFSVQMGDQLAVSELTAWRRNDLGDDGSEMQTTSSDEWVASCCMEEAGTDIQPPPPKRARGITGKKACGSLFRFSCPDCPQRFRQKNHITLHINAVHHKLKPYHCTGCDKSFGTGSNLRRHVRMVHEKVRNHLCPVCRFPFCEPGDMKKHHRRKHPEYPPLDI